MCVCAVANVRRVLIPPLPVEGAASTGVGRVLFREDQPPTLHACPFDHGREGRWAVVGAMLLHPRPKVLDELLDQLREDGHVACWVGSGRVESGRVGSGRVGSDEVSIVTKAGGFNNLKNNVLV